MRNRRDIRTVGDNLLVRPRFTTGVVLCALLLAASLGAQEAAKGNANAGDQSAARLAGTVVDESGGALVDATVTVSSSAGTTQAKTTTDANGMFDVRGVRPGRYRVRIERKMFTTVQVEVDVVDDVPTAPVRAVLKVSGVTAAVEVQAQGGYVVHNAITATKTDAPLFGTPVAVSVVPGAVLEEQQTGRIADGLKNVSSA